MIEPDKGRVYDPCCGSAGVFVQSIAFIRAHASGNNNGGKAKGDISIDGQESNYTTRRLARFTLASRGIDGRIEQGDTFHNDRFPDLKADFILANPPFNVSDWRGELLREDTRGQYGVPPVGHANQGEGHGAPPYTAYEHRGKERLNDPPVGLVTPDTDPDAGQKKKRYQYDPHLDPQLVWAGKAEHTSFEVPTVSLHVHACADDHIFPKAGAAVAGERENVLNRTLSAGATNRRTGAKAQRRFFRSA